METTTSARATSASTQVAHGDLSAARATSESPCAETAPILGVAATAHDTDPAASIHAASATRRGGRAIGWLGAGVLCGTLVVLARASSPAAAPPGPIALWVADRDGHEVLGLDANLFVARTIPVPWPMEVEPTRDGGLWVLRGSNGQVGSSVRLERFAPDGTVLTTLYLDHGQDLDVLDGEQALLLSREGPLLRLLRVRTEGSLFVVHQAPDLCALTASRGSILVGTSTGLLRRIDPATNAVVDELQLEDGASIDDLEPGPTPGSSWLLDGQGPSRLFLVDDDLSIRWAAGVGFAAHRVAGVPGQERVWIGDPTAGRAVRIGPNGVFELDAQNLSTTGIEQLLPWRKGGALALTPGAILHLTAQGGTAPGQGGFAWLSDLARAR